MTSKRNETLEPHSLEHDEAPHDWVDRWWTVGLAVFGVVCVLYVGCYTASW